MNENAKIYGLTPQTGAGQLPISSAYQYNSANQRTRNTQVDGSFWQYQYDSLGQVTSGHKVFADGTPMPGQQFDYAFDNIGNRTQSLFGGDQNGANQRTNTYAANNLNQYRSETVAGYVNVIGASFATNSVTVNGQAPYRKGEYFREELAATNGSGPDWQSVSVATNGQTAVSGHVLVPPASQQFLYDQDGNLTNDSVWVYIWDAENCLVQMSNTAALPTAAQRKLDFVYDYQGRRVQKIVSTNDGTAWWPITTSRFVYDGWNLVAELDGNNNLTRSFVWGLDLSGSIQGAGGVGGLVVVSQYGSQTTTTNCFAAYDGNGNVTALVNAADGTVVARYEYGPFGEVIRSTGPMAKANPFRFSTKYQDDESDLLYYGYRYYKASTGAWLSRDPIEEQGGLNLYEFSANDSLNVFDGLGLKVTFTPKPLPPHAKPNPVGNGVEQTGNTHVSYSVGWKGTPCCNGKYKYELTGEMTAEYWWLNGDNGAKAHEETHVGNAKGAVDEMNGYEDSQCHNPCWSDVLNKGVALAIAREHYEDLTLDANSYGNLEPQLYQDARQALADLFRAVAAYIRARGNCD